MSTHAIPAGTDTERLRALLPARLRQPSGWVLGATTAGAPTAVEFSPDLTAGEQATLAAALTESARPDYLALRQAINGAGNLNAIKAAVLAYLDAMPKT